MIFENITEKDDQIYTQLNILHKPEQLGFRASRLSQLLLQNADIIYADFTKTFGECAPGVTALTLRAMGIISNHSNYHH